MIIKTRNVNKEEEHLFLLREMITREVTTGVYSNKARYNILSSQGEYVGFIEVSVSNNNKADRAEIEYKSSEKHRNKNNITISLEEVLKDIFVKNSFDNKIIRPIFPKTFIKQVFLSITEGNLASEAVAKKSGFNQNGRHFEITREQFLEKVLQNSSIISSAVDATKDTTRISTVNEQISNIKEQEGQNKDLNNSIEADHQ